MKMRNKKHTAVIVFTLALLLAAAQGAPAQQSQKEKETPSPAPAARAAGARAAELRALAAYQTAGGGSFLGVGTRDIKAERMAELKLSEQRGVEIMEVDGDAPAGKAGLQSGDVILEFNGARVESVASLKRMLSETPPGRTATLGISRNGQRQNVQVELGSPPQRMVHSRVLMAPRAPDAPRAMRVLPAPAVPAMVMAYRSPMHGLMVENLNQQLGEFFGVKGGEGVLVRSVEKGSPAETAGFRAGDVIIQVQDEKVVDASDFRRALRKQKGGTTVPVRVVREKREQQLSLSVPEGRGGETSFNFDVDFDFDSEQLRLELERLGPELERMRPELERLAAELSAQTAHELRKATAEVEKAMRQAADEMERQRRAEETDRQRKERETRKH
jgi:serine protease Do